MMCGCVDGGWWWVMMALELGGREAIFIPAGPLRRRLMVLLHDAAPSAIADIDAVASAVADIDAVPSVVVDIDAACSSTSHMPRRHQYIAARGPVQTRRPLSSRCAAASPPMTRQRTCWRQDTLVVRVSGRCSRCRHRDGTGAMVVAGERGGWRMAVKEALGRPRPLPRCQDAGQTEGAWEIPRWRWRGWRRRCLAQGAVLHVRSRRHAARRLLPAAIGSRRQGPPAHRESKACCTCKLIGTSRRKALPRM